VIRLCRKRFNPLAAAVGAGAKGLSATVGAGAVIVVLVALSGFALSACGGDDEQADDTPTETAERMETTETESTSPEPAETETEPAETEPSEGDRSDTEPSPPPPEEQQGGAGDEEPARSLALLTGEGGRITPRVVRVPPFISIRVELRSADGREYGLVFAGPNGRATVRVSGGLSSVSTAFDGLRPGEALIGRPIGAGNRVRIEATAEPGP